MAQRRLRFDGLSPSWDVHYRVAFPQQRLYFLPEPQPQDRCVRFFTLPGVSLRRVLPLSFGAPAQNIRKSLSLLQRRRGSIFLGVPHRYRPCKDAFLDQDRARKLKPEWEPTDCTVHRRIVLTMLHGGS